MANIMITQKCNLACEYCFANEFVNKDSTDISQEAFCEILDFILSDGSEGKLGLIGGEPTLHNGFDKILELLINDERIQNVVIYTNGIKAGDFVDKLQKPKFHLLINCNDISDNSSLYTEFINSLELLFDKMSERIVFGINYYKLGYDYSHILRLIERFPCKRLRVSISVPNTDTYNYEPLSYFEKIKPEIFCLFKELKQRGTIPFLDCNILPPCLVTAAEMAEFDEWGADNPLSIIKNRQTGCIPVIDILPDLTAVRCFGLSEYTKVNIRDFSSISDLRNYYLRTVDAYAVNTFHNEKCLLCYKYKTMKCSGGCLIYKIDKILQKKGEA